MISIVTKWWYVPGREQEAVAALTDLVQQVRDGEPDTLMYCLHTADVTGSLPPPTPNEVIFLGAWTDRQAFEAHRKGKIFTDWLEKYLHLFVQNDGKLYVSAEFADRFAGFVRGAAVG
ncbi:antibiotic biosynthesis monooxygenase [Kitasatospora sp. NBC_00240]|uniref:putative quinol monooxygenase n=1 Tax=Kitasatospora sp. NBC_00240 TaxID=2903567 RepID=UPI0022500124|nr:antibiotic biosynthesis monooxygenase [Kitasatospora sp. NBC_00240]MCX5214326.1 antibiotic biosynthesis monooxygenase [Kitasatospora sp. NBC_00240]